MKSLRTIFVLAAIAAIWTAESAHGQAIGNASFETPDTNTDGGTFHVIADPATTASQPWTFSGESGIAENTSPGARTTPAGKQYAYMVLDNANAGIFSQPIVFSTAGSFRLSYLEAGDNPTGTGDTGDLNYRVTLQQSSNTPILSVDDFTVSSQNFSVTSYNFTVPAAGTYNLSFTPISHRGPNTFDETFIDQVAITSIPEPFADAFVVAGAALFGVMRPSRRGLACAGVLSPR